MVVNTGGGGAVNSNSRLAEYISSCSAFIFLMQCACGYNRLGIFGTQVILRKSLPPGLVDKPSNVTLSRSQCRAVRQTRRSLRTR